MAATTDNFNRANETPVAGNWDSGPGSWDNVNLNTNACRLATAGTNGAASYKTTARTFNSDHYSQIALKTFNWAASFGEMGPVTRMQGTGANAGDCYWFEAMDNPDFKLFRVDDASGSLTFNQLGATITTPDPAQTNTLKLESSGSSHTMYQNGSSLRAADTDATYTGGQPGFAVRAPSTPASFEVDDWEADDLGGGGGRTTKNTRAFPLGTEVGMNWRMAH